MQGELGGISLFGVITDDFIVSANKSVSLTTVVHLQWRASSILLWEHLPSCRDGTACPETEGYLRRDVTTLFWSLSQDVVLHTQVKMPIILNLQDVSLTAGNRKI